MTSMTSEATSRTANLTSRTANLTGGPVPYLLRPTKRARGLRATIDPRLGLVVSLPPPNRLGWAAPEAIVEAFLRSREAWLRRHLARRQASLAALAERGVARDGGLLRFRGAIHRLRIEAGGGRRTTIELDPDPAGDGAEGGTIRVRLAASDPRTPAAILRDWCRSAARRAVEAAIEDHRAALAATPKAISIRDPRTRWGSASRQGRLSFSWRLILAPPAALDTVVVHELAHLRVFGHGPDFWVLVASRRPDHAVWRRWLRDHALELHLALDDRGRLPWAR